MKAAYWKRTIAPEVARRFEFVWLADFDISLDSLNLASFTRVMQRVGVPLMQPRIASDATYFTHLKAIETVRREYTELLGRKNRQVLLSEPATISTVPSAPVPLLSPGREPQAVRVSGTVSASRRLWSPDYTYRPPAPKERGVSLSTWP